MMDNINDRLFKLISDVLQIDISDVNENLSPENSPQWDSLKNIMLLMAIEEEFDFRFTDEEMTKRLNASSILEILKNK